MQENSTLISSSNSPVTTTSPDMARHQAEQAIVEWAAASRGSYERRRDYNHEICNRLASAGIPPLAAIVIRLGRWGQSGSVAEDVASWYAELATRLAERDANIPVAARKQANELLESVWRLAQVEIDQRVLEPLRHSASQREMLNEQLSAEVSRLREAASQELEARQDLSSRLEQQTAQTAEFQQQAEAEKAKSEKLVQELAASKAQTVQEAQQQRAAHAMALDEARQKLDTEVSRANAERGALLLKIDNIQLESRKWSAKVQELQASMLEQLTQLATTKEAFNDSTASVAALQLESSLARRQISSLTEDLARAEARTGTAVSATEVQLITQIKSTGFRLVREFSEQPPERPEWMSQAAWASLEASSGDEGYQRHLIRQLSALEKQSGRNKIRQ